MFEIREAQKGDEPKIALINFNCWNESYNEFIAPKILDFKNKKFKPQQSFETVVSASYDAIAVIAKPKDLLKCDPLKLFTFLQETFHQCKFIGYEPELSKIFQELKLKPDHGIMALESASDCQAFIKLCRKLRYWERSKT